MNELLTSLRALADAFDSLEVKGVGSLLGMTAVLELRKAADALESEKTRADLAEERANKLTEKNDELDLKLKEARQLKEIWEKNACNWGKQFDDARRVTEPLHQVAGWTQALLTALNVGDIQSGSLIHLKIREVMGAYRAAGGETT